MALVLSPSISFCDLNRQQSQMLGCYGNISLQANHRVPQKLLQHYDLPWFDGELNLETLFSTNPLHVPNAQPSASLTAPACESDRWRTPSPTQHAQSCASNARNDLPQPLAATGALQVAIPQTQRVTRQERAQRSASGDVANPVQQFMFVPPFIEGFEDVLFSSLRSDLGGLRHKLSNLCSLCRHPFESNDIDALIKHVRSHSTELLAGFSCETCNAEFAFKADLEWHRRCQKSGQICHSAPSVDNAETSQNSLKLIEWEQVQIKAHSREVDHAIGTGQSRSRSSSVPPVDRKLSADRFVEANRPELDTISSQSQTKSALDNVHSRKHLPASEEARFRKMGFHVTDEDRMKDTTHSQISRVDLKPSVWDIQMRIRSLTEKIDYAEESPADSQMLSCNSSPVSSFSDSASSPEATTPSLQIILEKSSPRTPRVGLKPPQCSNTQAGLDDAAEGGSASQGTRHTQMDYSTNTAPKRRNGERDDDQEDNENIPNKGFNSKRRKVGMASSDEEKRFPCICYIGEPQRFSSDVAKHKHISNMCRHMKSHSFYVCSSCIMHFQSEEDLDNHLRCHIRNCRKKGCKRQRPAFAAEADDCNHLMTAEQQWREMFRLRYDREPPDVFSSQARNVAIQGGQNAGVQCFDDVESYLNNVTPSVVETPMPDIDAEIDDYYDQDYTGHLLDRAQQSAAPAFDFSPFVETPAADNVYLTPTQTNESFNVTLDITAQPSFTTNPGDVSSQRLFETLQSQLKSLESKMENQVLDDRQRIFSLQSQAAQLEQKLFQSSEREKQLEALLGVIFDNFQRTGAPQVQPNTPLWKLVVSHISPAATTDGQRSGIVAAASSPPEAGTSQMMQSSKHGKQAGERMVRTDSAYGSTR